MHFRGGLTACLAKMRKLNKLNTGRWRYNILDLRVYSGYILIRVEWIALCPWRPKTNMDNSQGNHIVKVDGHPAWHCHQGISFFPNFVK
jgi:hypothetical protein